ncbi:MAG: hypothetical protein VX346_23840 [Planctomycetota bacterium]|nr:hypothetical protein [Planctomycetota bacterium]
MSIKVKQAAVEKVDHHRALKLTVLPEAMSTTRMDCAAGGDLELAFVRIQT